MLLIRNTVYSQSFEVDFKVIAVQGLDPYVREGGRLQLKLTNM